ncbi:hypothetical protein AB0K14_04765 [Actinosynnema sp. NPDC050801]|uniref:hypothetical protein n=1 Tax=unclassified Actinosynnema TaxID=2637065 RepID=UPI0033F797B7
MPTWIYFVIFCAVLLLVAYLVDRRARAQRAGLVAPADTRGRSGADTIGRARLGPHGAGGSDGITSGSYGSDGIG